MNTATTSPVPTIDLNGREYRVNEIGPREAEGLNTWLKAQVPDPRVEVHAFMKGQPDAVAIEIWREASERAKSWPPRLGSQEAVPVLVTTVEGNAQLALAVLHRHNPGFAIDAARELVATLGMSDINRLVALAFGSSRKEPAKPPRRARASR